MTVLTGQLLLCDQPPAARISPGTIYIADGHIAEVVIGEMFKDADYGNANSLISPGFIDTHLHLPQFDMIGAHGMPLLDWLQNVTFPSERKWEDTQYAQSMTKRLLKQCLSVGTTGICAYATVHHESTLASLKVATEASMRGVIGQVLMDREAPAYLIRERQQLVDETNATLEAFSPGSRMAAAVTPRFAISCTAELLASAGQLARQFNATIQTHLAETRRECDFVKELFGGTRYIDVYRQAGLHTNRTIYGHGIHLDGPDRQSLSDRGAIVAHCPTANSFLRSGTMDRATLIKERVRVSLGSDIGAGYERSMIRVARAMIETASALGDEYPTAAEAWYQITAGNAQALNWKDAGHLKVGDPADVLVIDPDIPWLESEVDSLTNLMYAWDDRWLKETFLLGTPIRR